MTAYQEWAATESRQTIFRLVAKHDLGVQAAAEILGVSRQSVWYRRQQLRQYGSGALVSRKRGPKSGNRAWNRTTPRQEERVITLRRQTQAGPQTLCRFLEEEGILLAKMTVYRILIRTGLIPRRSRKKPTYQRYTLGYPGAEVQIDTTQIEDSQERFWVFAAVDDHTRWAWAMAADRCLGKHARAFLEQIITTAPFPITAVRTDHGSEYGPAFTKECRRLGIHHIRNRPKTPQHNGKVERFHRTVQEECLWYKWHWQMAMAEAAYRLTQFLAFYNHRRPHQGLGMAGRSPIQQLRRWITTNAESANVKRTMVLYRA